MHYFRVYHDVIDDPKLGRLPLKGFGAWVSVLCVASKMKVRGTLPDVDEIAFRLHRPVEEVVPLVEDLVARKLLVRDGSGRLSVHNWDEYQRPDTSAERQKAYRSRLSKRDAVLLRDDFTCVYCGARDVPLVIDHRVPKSRGGSNEMSNLAASCVPCNSSKGARTPEEWRP